MSRALVLSLLYGLVALVLITVAVIVRIEWRAAHDSGAHGRWRPRIRKPAGSTAPGAENGIGLDDLDSFPPHERPARMLRVLVEALTRSRRLDRDRDLTCRELIAHARFDDEGQREEFRLVALLAEGALYGSQRARYGVSAEQVRGARALRAQLLAAPASAQSANA